MELLQVTLKNLFIPALSSYMKTKTKTIQSCS